MRIALPWGLLAAAAAFATIAGEPRPGDYGMNGGGGLLGIVDRGDGQRRFVLDTVGANGHVCRLAGRIEAGRAIPGDGEGACEVSMVATGDRVGVRAEGGGCRWYCGLRAGFEGGYARMPAGCLPQQRERRNAAFLAEYGPRRHDRALALPEQAERECGTFCDRVERDASANDMAITLYHLVRYRRCPEVLQGTRAPDSRDLASLDEAPALPPAETCLPVAQATWHNRALCERGAGRPSNRGRPGECGVPRAGVLSAAPAPARWPVQDASGEGRRDGCEAPMNACLPLTLALLAALSGRAARAQDIGTGAHAAPGSDARAERTLEAGIRRLDLAHAAAILRGDAVALEALMDDGVTVNHPTGRIVGEKRELLDLVAQGVIRYTAFERRPERFLFFPGMVVVMGGETVVPAPGAPNAGKRLQRRYTNAWMRRDDRWRLAFRHANNVCPPAPVQAKAETD